MAQKSRRHLAIIRQDDTASTAAAVNLPDSKALADVAQDIAKLDTDVLFQVGELAKLTGKSVRAIHLYEDMGLLSPVERSAGRYRLYNSTSAERVRWIIKLHALGFSLPDVKQLLSDQAQAHSGKAAATLLRASYVEKLDAVQGRLAELHRLEQELLSSLTYLDACQSACEGDLDRNCCPDCSLHVDQSAAPSLVSGAQIN